MKKIILYIIFTILFINKFYLMDFIYNESNYNQIDLYSFILDDIIVYDSNLEFNVQDSLYIINTKEPNGYFKDNKKIYIIDENACTKISILILFYEYKISSLLISNNIRIIKISNKLNIDNSFYINLFSNYIFLENIYIENEIILDGSNYNNTILFNNYNNLKYITLNCKFINIYTALNNYYFIYLEQLDNNNLLEYNSIKLDGSSYYLIKKSK